MSDKMELSHVRSLTVFCSSMKNFWLMAPSLLTLDLHNCWKLLDCDLAHMEKMHLVKYLSLGSKLITKLPKAVEQMQNIETLDLKGTNIKELPSYVARLPRLARLYVSSYTRFPDGIIGQMRSLEDLHEMRMYFFEEAKSLQEFSQLTNLRTLKVGFSLFQNEAGSLDEAKRQSKEFFSIVGTLVSSRNLHHLYFSGENDINSFGVPMPLESWCQVTPCSLRKLRIPLLFIDKVPKWMSSHGNLRELELSIMSMEPEDVAILGAMPVLLYLTLSTKQAHNGRILIRGFAGLKYFKLNLLYCGIKLEFEAGAMPKLEHLVLKLPVHRMGCLNGVSDFGIRHLLAMTNLKVLVDSEKDLYTPEDLTREEAVSLIRTLIGTLHISPAISTLPRVKSRGHCSCFEEYKKDYLRRRGLLPEDIPSVETEAVHGEPENSRRSEQIACDMSNLRVLDESEEEEEKEEKYSAAAGGEE